MNTELATTENTDLYVASEYSTIVVNDKETKKTVVNAMNAAESLANHEGETLSIIGVMCKPGIRRARDKNGVDAPCTDTILVGTDGRAYFSQSEGVRNACDNFNAAGLFEDGEPVDMKLTSTVLPSGNTRKTLVLV